MVQYKCKKQCITHLHRPYKGDGPNVAQRNTRPHIQGFYWPHHFRIGEPLRPRDGHDLGASGYISRRHGGLLPRARVSPLRFRSLREERQRQGKEKIFMQRLQKIIRHESRFSAQILQSETQDVEGLHQMHGRGKDTRKECGTRGRVLENLVLYEA